MKALCLLLSLGIFAAYSAQTSLDTGLVRNYPFNGNANSVSPNFSNGTAYGATLTTDRFGNLNSAYSFNGSTDYILIQYDSLLLSEYTYSIWVLTQSIPALGTETNVIFIGEGNIPYCQGIKAVNLGSGFYNGWVGYGGYYDSLSSPVQYITYNNANLIPNVWKHIVITRSANAMKLYIDGLLTTIDSTTYTTYPEYGIVDQMSLTVNGSANIGVGGSIPSYYTGFFHGKIDDVKIYKRAININEVNALYNASSSGNASLDLGVLKFNLSPNPTSGKAILNYNLNQHKNANFQLFDVQGKLVYQTELSTNEDKAILTLDKLDNGLYFGKVYADGILVKTEKIVKSN
jgi:hypothetical protein